MNTLQSQHTQVGAFERGLTLIEIMVTLAVVAITLSIGVPSFQGMMSDNRMTTTANSMISALNVARSEAIKRGRAVDMTSISSDWSNGWKVTVTRASVVEDIKTFGPITGMQFTGGSAAYQFLPSGFISLASAQVITLCNSAISGETGRQINISVSGRFSVTNYTCT